jgi:Phospholipase/Carboxylesterase
MFARITKAVPLRINLPSNNRILVASKCPRSTFVNASSMIYPKPIVVAPLEKHTSTIIFLHGLGDSGDGWSFLPTVIHSALPHAKFIFPSAPKVLSPEQCVIIAHQSHCCTYMRAEKCHNKHGDGNARYGWHLECIMTILVADVEQMQHGMTF